MKPGPELIQSSAIEGVLQRLEALQGLPDAGADQAIAKSWNQALGESQAFLARVDRQVVFVGEVGDEFSDQPKAFFVMSSPEDSKEKLPTSAGAQRESTVKVLRVKCAVHLLCNL